MRMQLKIKLKCKNLNDLGKHKPTCVEASANLQSYLNSLTGKENIKENGFSVNDVNSSETTDFLNSRMDRTTDVLIAKWNADSASEKDLDPKVKKEKLEAEKLSESRAFSQIMFSLGSNIHDKQELIKKLCNQPDFDQNSSMEMTKILNILVQNRDKSKFNTLQVTAKNSVGKRRELLESQLLRATLINPDFYDIANDPRQICKIVEEDDTEGVLLSFYKLGSNFGKKQLEQVEIQDQIKNYLNL